MGSKRGTCGSKTTSSLKPASKSKKKKSEGTAPVIIDITKQGSSEANIELWDSILCGGTSPVVELDKIHSTEGGEDMPLPDAPGAIIPIYAQDEETRAAAEVLKMLQKQQPTANLPRSSSLSTPPSQADILKAWG